MNAAEDLETGTIHLIDNKIITDNLVTLEVIVTIETIETRLLRILEANLHNSNKQDNTIANSIQDKSSTTQADILETIRQQGTMVTIQPSQINNSDQIPATDTKTKAPKDTDLNPETDIIIAHSEINSTLTVSALHLRIHDHKITGHR